MDGTIDYVVLRASSRERGFTLLEVMIATVLFTIVATIAFKIISDATDHQANVAARSDLAAQGNAALRIIERELHESGFYTDATYGVFPYYFFNGSPNSAAGNQGANFSGTPSSPVGPAYTHTTVNDFLTIQHGTTRDIYKGSPAGFPNDDFWPARVPAANADAAVGWGNVTNASEATGVNPTSPIREIIFKKPLKNLDGSPQIDPATFKVKWDPAWYSFTLDHRDDPPGSGRNYYDCLVYSIYDPTNTTRTFGTLVTPASPALPYITPAYNPGQRYYVVARNVVKVLFEDDDSFNNFNQGAPLSSATGLGVNGSGAIRVTLWLAKRDARNQLFYKVMQETITMRNHSS